MYAAKGRHRVRTVLLLVWIAMAAVGGTAADEPQLRFAHSGKELRRIGLSTLRIDCSAAEIEVADPYHKRRTRYFALPLSCVLDLGFEGEGGAEGQRSKSLLLRALDGYTRPVSGQDLLEVGAYLAFGEPDLMRGIESPPVFSKIDRRGVDPGPFYLVWTGPDQSDSHVHPWPYQLATIEIAPFSEGFPHTVPTELDPGNMGWAGYALFQRSCASCHAINGEGGKVGPDLNIPRSIVEYRPLPQIRSYIRDPQKTRYTSMPAHPNLTESDLDALIAYFRAMSRRKHDPNSPEGS
ncbi:MAG: cytochrome c [Myxococcales bacterium]|nr:cytochrome c [Myxococcales bacterium]